jgi:hypothetical protein
MFGNDNRIMLCSLFVYFDFAISNNNSSLATADDFRDHVKQQALNQSMDDQQTPSPNKASEKAAEAAARDLLGKSDGEDITASFRKKKTKTKKTEDVVEFGGEGGPRHRRSESPSEMSVDPPDNEYPRSVPHIPSPSKRGVATDAASVSSFRSYASVRSVDPESGVGIGEIWEVSRPTGLVRDGGNDHGYFYVPSPASADGSAFQAFLTNQKYTTQRAPCVDWRAWVDNNPHSTLIHFSEVPREAVVKGRHILETRPGSAFFSHRQLALDDEIWEDSGAYAQMFAFARDAPNGGQGGKRTTGFGQEIIVPKEDPDNVSFLRKGFNQNIVAGIVAFTGPGLFNAMQGLGNAGGSDPSVSVFCLDIFTLVIRIINSTTIVCIRLLPR